MMRCCYFNDKNYLKSSHLWFKIKALYCFCCKFQQVYTTIVVEFIIIYDTLNFDF